MKFLFSHFSSGMIVKKFICAFLSSVITVNAVKFGKVRVKRIGQHFVVKLEHKFGNFHIYHIFEF